MKRIVISPCTICGKEAGLFESSQFPSLKLGYDCVDAVIQFAFDNQIQQNPLMTELLSGVSSIESGTTVTCWPEHDDGIKKQWTYRKFESFATGKETS